jgi:UDP-N-acetylglucosamine acyltransferase
MSVEIHPTAIVSKKAVLSDGVRIGPYCLVDESVEIGANTVLKSFVSIKRFVRVGENCTLFENVTLGGEPQDFGFKGEETWVRIGNGVTLRENVTIHRATGEGKETVIGANCYLMEGSHVGHNVFVSNDVILANKVGLAGHVHVGEKTVLGGMAGVHQFVRIGPFCMIGGLSKIVKDVPPYVMADGRPARLFGLNKVGLRRNGFDAEARKSIKAFYKGLYHANLPLREAMAALEDRLAETPEPTLGIILDFAKESHRGLTPWPKTMREVDSTD